MSPRPTSLGRPRHSAAVVASTLLAAASLLVPSGRAAASSGERLPTDVLPTFQSVELTLDPDSASYHGTVRVELRVTRRTDAIRFHAKEMTLRSAVLRRGGNVTRLVASVDSAAIVTAKADRPIEAGDCTLEVEFAKEFDRRASGLYRLETGGRWYAFSQFEAIDARKAFPCWDEPSFKFPYQVTLHVPEADRAVSNTPVASERVERGMRTVVFKRTKPLPSYLIAVAVGPFEFVPMPGAPRAGARRDRPGRRPACPLRRPHGPAPLRRRWKATSAFPIPTRSWI